MTNGRLEQVYESVRDKMQNRRNRALCERKEVNPKSVYDNFRMSRMGALIAEGVGLFYAGIGVYDGELNTVGVGLGVTAVGAILKYVFEQKIIKNLSEDVQVLRERLSKLEKTEQLSEEEQIKETLRRR